MKNGNFNAKLMIFKIKLIAYRLKGRLAKKNIQNKFQIFNNIKKEFRDIKIR